MKATIPGLDLLDASWGFTRAYVQPDDRYGYTQEHPWEYLPKFPPGMTMEGARWGARWLNDEMEKSLALAIEKDVTSFVRMYMSTIDFPRNWLPPTPTYARSWPKDPWRPAFLRAMEMWHSRFGYDRAHLAFAATVGGHAAAEAIKSYNDLRGAVRTELKKRYYVDGSAMGTYVWGLATLAVFWAFDYATTPVNPYRKTVEHLYKHLRRGFLKEINEP